MSDHINNYIEATRHLRAARRLHPAVLTRLSELLARRFRSACTVQEISLVPGGRNDAVHFEFNGRRICFEVFASVSQVPQDLRLLEQADAEVRVAILLDQTVDPDVATEYFRKKPNAFPFLWVRDILDPSRESITLARLGELLDEHSNVRRVRSLMAGRYGAVLETTVARVLSELEQKTAAIASPVAPPRLTGHQVLALLIITEVRRLGIPIDRLRSLFAWLSLSAPYAIELALLGFQAFLVTDLADRHAIWSDNDLVDDQVLGAYSSSRASIVLCLNSAIHKVIGRAAPTDEDIKWHLFHTYSEFIEKVIPKAPLASTPEDA